MHTKEQSLLFDRFKAFHKIESIHKSNFSNLKRPIVIHACASCSELPSNVMLLPGWADVCDQDLCDPDVSDLDVCDHLFVTKTFVTRTFVTWTFVTTFL